MRKLKSTFFCFCFLIPTVKARNAPLYGDIRDSVDLQLHTVKQTLIAGHPGIAYLEVINNSPDSLDLTVSIQKPDFLTVKSSATHIILSPKNSFVVAEQLDVANRTYPGTGLVLYQVAITYLKNGQRTETSKVVTQEVEMGILGESGIMTVLGLNIFSIPFFLVLPGFLFLVVWSSFLPAAYKTQKTLLAPEKKEPFFWVATITLSLVLSILYAFISSQAVWISYGLLDVFFLWMGSILLAILLLFAVYISIARRARYEASKDFTVRDTPWMVLERLRKRDAGFYLDQGESADAAGLVFKLGINRLQPAEPPVCWYSCGIFAKKADAVTQGSTEEKVYKDLVEYLRDMDTNGATGDIDTLIHRLRGAEKVGAIVLVFDREPGVGSSTGSFTVTRKHKSIVHS